MYILKKYFNHIKLNSTYNGGLSSFSLFLLVLAYLKSVLDEQIGTELYHFFIFFEILRTSENTKTGIHFQFQLSHLKTAANGV